MKKILFIMDRKRREKGKEMENFITRMEDYMKGNGLREEWQVKELFPILREDWLIMGVGSMI